MECQLRNLDDMYQDDDFCSSVDYVALSIAQLVVLLLLVQVQLAVALLIRDKTWSRIFVLEAFGCLLTAPVLAGRSFTHRPLLLHPVCSVLFCIGTLLGNTAGDMNCRLQLQQTLGVTKTFFPSRCRTYLAWLPLVVLMNAPLFAALVVFLIRGLHVATEQTAVITVFFGGFYFLWLFFRVGALLVLHLEMYILETILPEGAPDIFRNQFQARRHGSERSLALRGLPVAVLGIAILFIDNWQRYGGLIFLYILSLVRISFDLYMLCCLLVKLRQNAREATKREELHAMAQQLDLSEVVLPGRRGACAVRSGSVPPVWERGVSYALLESFITSYNIPSHYTTMQVVESVIKPMTATSRRSAWEAIFLCGDAKAGALLGRSNAMVSHSWGNSFVSLASILRKQEEVTEGAFFFLDIFSMNQHTLVDKCTQDVCDRLLEDLKMAVSFPGRMVMVLEPWSQPKPLSRCWCLYEVYLARSTQTKLDMAFGDGTAEEISRALVGNLNLARDLAKLADVRKAEATFKRDREMILAAIQKEIGLDQFIELIRATLADSLYVATLGSCLQDGPLLLRANARPGPSVAPIAVERLTVALTALTE